MVAKGKPYSLVRWEFASGKAQKGTVLEQHKSWGLTTQENGGKRVSRLPLVHHLPIKNCH